MIDHALHFVDVRGLAVDEQTVAVSLDADVEQRFEVAEILVVGAEEGFDTFIGHSNLAHAENEPNISLRGSPISFFVSELPKHSSRLAGGRQPGAVPARDEGHSEWVSPSAAASPGVRR